MSHRPSLAVDFGADIVAVRFAPEGGEWTELGTVALTAEDFTEQMTALASHAGERTGGDMRAELWLPASQIVNLHIEDSPRQAVRARRDAAARLSSTVGVAADDLCFDLSERTANGAREACATERSTVAEATSYAASWGFAPRIVTTRHAGAGFSKPPRFEMTPRVGALVPLAAAVVLAVGLGAGAYWWLRDGPHNPPVVDLDTVATAPSPVQEPVANEEATSLVTGENTVSHLGAAPLNPAPKVTIAEPEGSGPPLSFSVAAGTPPLSPPELEAPLDVPGAHRSGVALAEVTGPDPALAPEFAEGVVPNIDQTPVEPPAPAVDDRETSPDPDAGAHLASGPDEQPVIGARAVPLGPEGLALAEQDPVAPQGEDDLALTAAEAEAWAEAEGAAEAETGAEAPEAPIDDAPLLATTDLPGPEPEAHEADLLTDLLPDPDESEVNELSGVGADTVSEEPAEVAEAPETDTIYGSANPSDVALLAPSVVLSRPSASTPELAESDDFDAIDTGPGPGSVLRAPAPAPRPRALDMTPSELAVLTSPVPGHRPASIKPRPKPVLSGARTASAPRRGKPSGPGLARAATLVDVLPLDDVSLLGTFGQGQSRRALLRMPTGEVVRVSRGDVVQGWVVGKIEALSMRITRGGEARTLPLAR